MSYQDLLNFIQEYYGILCGDTPANFGQCVGLIEIWLDKLGLNTPHLYGNAKDLLNNADTSKFDVIHNDINNPNQFPLPGDIFVYGDTWGGGDGHTGVILIADGKSVILFEQNNPGIPVLKRETYKGCLGWLHPKNFKNPQQIEDELRTARDTNWDLLEAQRKTNSDLQANNEDLKKQLTECINSKVTDPVENPQNDVKSQQSATSSATIPIESVKVNNSVQIDYSNGFHVIVWISGKKLIDF